MTPGEPSRRIVYLGTPEVAVAPLRALVDAGHDVVLVVSRSDKRRGRGAGATPSPVKAAALEMGLSVSHDLDDVATCGADLGVVVAYGRIIPAALLVPPDGVDMVNLHFSLLPRWRGAAPVERAILAGDARTGVCVMRVEAGLDTGAVFARTEVAIGDDETADELRGRLVAVGCGLLLEVLSGPLPDPVAQSGEPTYAAKIRPDELRIDWSGDASTIHRLVRIGGAWTTFRGRRVKIVGVHRVATTNATGLEHPVVGLAIDTVQPEGKGPMAVADFIRGVRPGASERFE